jgi:uncharacterized membrane protein
LKHFVDAIAIEVIETTLVQALIKIFSLVTVYNMPSSLVTRIAGESKESHDMQEQLSKKLKTLRNRSKTCRRFVPVPHLGRKGLHS